MSTYSGDTKVKIGLTHRRTDWRPENIMLSAYGCWLRLVARVSS